MNNNIDEYENIVELLKQALKFYADNDNYSVNRKVNDSIFTQIQMDSGTQARFALDRANVFINARKKIENDINHHITNNSENFLKDNLDKLTDLNNMLNT